MHHNKNGKRIYPQIYLYSDKHNPAWVKVGYTTRKDPEDRIREQYNTMLKLDPDCYIFLHSTDSVRYDGSLFTDKLVHERLNALNIPNKGEFYKTDLYTISKVILDIKEDIKPFKLRSIDINDLKPVLPKIKNIR